MGIDLYYIKELLLINQAHLRVLQQLEAERIARETGQPIQLIEQRIQKMAEEIVEVIREENS